MVWLGRMGLQKKTFIYVGAGLGVLMLLLSFLSLQTINQGIDIVRQERLARVENIALDIDDVIEHMRAEMVNTALVLGRGWQDDLTDSHKEQLTSLQYHLRQHLMFFEQGEEAVVVAILDARGKVLWTEPYLARQVSQSLADTAAVREVVASGQVYL